MTEPAHRWFPDGLPDELLELPDLDLLRVLGKPTLIRVPGRGDQPPRALATLLHGDESSGYEAVLKVLRRRRTYAFDLYVVIGNVRAALADGGYRHRFLDDQEDFNRIWGIGEPTTMLRMAADGILDTLLEAGLEALIDVHNNSGDNPFYAIVTRTDPHDVNLATLFCTTLLMWNLNAHTLMEALPDDVASVAIECGRPGRPESTAFALDGIRRFLGEPPIPRERVARDFDLLGGLRKVVVRPEVRFHFGDELSDDVDLAVEEEADLVNFNEVPKGHVLGRVHAGAALPVRAIAPDGSDVTEQHFTVVDDVVVFTQPAHPVMMTRTEEAARKDCLFYLATELPPPSF